MADKVYQLEFISEYETKTENRVYSDLDNVIYSLDKEGYTRTTVNLFKKVGTDGKEEFVLIKELIHYGGRMMPKEHVYLKEPVYYRFLLFSYESYYPSGGTGDLDISFNTIEELEEKYEYLPFGLDEYIEVFDTKTGRIVNKSDCFPDVVEEVKEYLKNN